MWLNTPLYTLGLSDVTSPVTSSQNLSPPQPNTLSLLKWFVVFWAVMTLTFLWKRPPIQSQSRGEAVETGINNSYLDHYGMKNDLGNAWSGGREEIRKITTGLMDGHPCVLFHPCSPVAGNFGGVSSNANMEESYCWIQTEFQSRPISSFTHDCVWSGLLEAASTFVERQESIYESPAEIFS